jgi:hypothetical protein
VKTRLRILGYSKRSRWVIYPSVAIVAANFVTFILGSVYLGGDALNGHVLSGHYFLCAHGSCTEVSSSVWHYSYWHAWAAIGGIFLVFAETAFFLNTGDIQWE